MKAIAKILDIHAEDASFLWLQRDDAVRAPHYDLADLAELDNRLDANLDGLKVAGSTAWGPISKNLQLAEPGEVFVAAWFAITRQDGKKFDQVIEVVKGSSSEMPKLRRALCSALSWSDFPAVQPWLESFFSAKDPIFRYLALTTCAHRRMDLGEQLKALLRSEESELCSRALRTVGELGRKDLLPFLAEFYHEHDPNKRFWALWSAVLLGHAAALPQLGDIALSPRGIYRSKAAELYCRSASLEQSRLLIRKLIQQEQGKRLAIAAAGASGDAFWVPGLIKFMRQEDVSRIAGEALSMISGLDLAYLDYDRDQPEGAEFGPSEDAGDENVAVDPDEDLPWPDSDSLMQWWNSNQSNYQPGIRYLCGQVCSVARSNEVLRKGYQRQRRAAAIGLALYQPGLYNTQKSGLMQKADFATTGS